MLAAVCRYTSEHDELVSHFTQRLAANIINVEKNPDSSINILKKAASLSLFPRKFLAEQEEEVAKVVASHFGRILPFMIGEVISTLPF